MEPTVMIGVLVVVVLPLALMLFADAKGMFDQVGGGAFSVDNLSPPGSAAANRPATPAEREAEIRQFIEARNERRVARGEPALDVDGEVARLMSLDPASDPDAPPKVDPALREEVRQMVLARNERRIARGEPALDVEAEIDRQLREAGA